MSSAWAAQAYHREDMSGQTQEESTVGLYREAYRAGAAMTTHYSHKHPLIHTTAANAVSGPGVVPLRHRTGVRSSRGMLRRRRRSRVIPGSVTWRWHVRAPQRHDVH